NGRNAHWMTPENLRMSTELARFDLLQDTNEIVDFTERSANEREIAILQRDGRSIGILLPTEDPKLLEQIVSYSQDLLDAHEAQAVVDDTTEEWRSLARVRADLGL